MTEISHGELNNVIEMLIIGVIFRYMIDRLNMEPDTAVQCKIYRYIYYIYIEYLIPILSRNTVCWCVGHCIGICPVFVP